MKFSLVILLCGLAVGLTWYALWGRNWLKSKEWAQPFFDWIEPIEIFLYKKSPTILVARLLSALGSVLTLLTQIGSIDITPLMPLVPDKYEGIVRVAWNLMPMLITGLGMMVEKLRNATTLPIELVAVKEATATPEVKVAIAAATEAKEQAVATVKAAS